MNMLREHAVELAKKGDYEAAYMMLREEAENGDVDAYNDLGVIAERHGEYQMAMKFYEFAHKCGVAVAARNIGIFYKKGIYVKKDYSKAIEYFTIAAERGYAPAYDDLSMMAFDGLGMEKNDEKGLQYLLDGMKYENPEEPMLTTNAAYCYECGIGTPADPKKAYALYKKAAKAANGCTLYNYGICILLGKGIKQNVNKGLDLLMQSAEKDYPDAFYQLYRVYNEGELVKAHKDLAEFWLYKAMEHHCMRAFLDYAEISLAKEEPKTIEALFAISEYCLNMEENKDYQLLEDFKNKYPDLVDWDEFEKDPKGYVRKELEGIANFIA